MPQLALFTAQGDAHYVQLKERRTRDEALGAWRDRNREFASDWIETVNGDLVARSSIIRVSYVEDDGPAGA
jgi:hypothetical protein